MNARRTPVYIILTVILFGGTVPFVNSQDLSYMGSVEYATGSYYFTERTGSLYLNNGFSISGQKSTVSLNIPIISQNTPWTSYTGVGGPLPTGGPRSGTVSGGGQGRGQGQGKRMIDLGSTDSVSFAETHVGDPSINGSFQLYSSGMSSTIVNGTIGVKIPFTGPESGFGTGAWDVGVGLSWSQKLTGTTLLVLGGSYWWLGDMDELEFNNILSYSGALGYLFSNGKLMASASVLGSTPAIDDVDPPFSIGMGMNWQASPTLFLNANVQVGVTESSSDFGVGVGWSLRL